MFFEQTIQKILSETMESIQGIFEAVQADRYSKLNQIFSKLEELNHLRTEVDIKTKKWEELNNFVTNFNSQFGQFQLIQF